MQPRRLEDETLIFLTLEAGTLTGAAALGKPTQIAKDVRIAQQMMERGVNPTPEALADQDTPLRKVMKAG